MDPELKKLLDISISQHGYWLVNHIEIIKDDLTALLNHYHLVITASIINEIDNPITKALYKKIKEQK
jgi:hypothetical protein